MHGQKVAFILQLCDQLELPVDLLSHLGGYALRPAPGDALLGQLPQPGARRVAFRHQLAGILITQLAQVEMTAPGYREGFCQQLCGIGLRQQMRAT